MYYSFPKTKKKSGCWCIFIRLNLIQNYIISYKGDYIYRHHGSESKMIYDEWIDVTNIQWWIWLAMHARSSWNRVNLKEIINGSDFSWTFLQMFGLRSI